MGKCIDADKLIKELDKLAPPVFYADGNLDWFHDGYKESLSDTEKIIENQPTADVQEVNKDIPKKRYKIWYKYAYFYRCSKCKIYVDKDCKYCPNCGQALDWA